jgi:hypothetical protein
MVVSPATQLLNFSALTDAASQLRVWVDNHILLDCPAGRPSGWCLPRETLPVSSGAPVQLRVELTHGVGGGAALALYWSGNSTTFSEVPASALLPAVPAWETQRVAMRDRLQSPAVPWQTWTQNMAAHVLMPQGLSLDATLRNLATGEELGNIAPWRSFKPANVRPGIHSINGSDYTHFTLSRWGVLNCSIDFFSTVVQGDLVWLIESAGADCGGLAVVFRALVKWGYSGALSSTSASSFTAALPGFDNVTAALVSGAPLPPATRIPAVTCNITGAWCCDTTSVVEDGAGRLWSTADYGTGQGNITANNVSMFFTNAPSRHFFGYVEAPACDTVHWLNDGSSWRRAPPPPPPPFSPFSVALGGGPIVLATGRAALSLNATAARVLVSAAAERASAWLDDAAPGFRDAVEPLSAVLTWDTVFTPYLTAVTASSRLWVCTGANSGCQATGYTCVCEHPPCARARAQTERHELSLARKGAYLSFARNTFNPPPPSTPPPTPIYCSVFNWDMPMCAWTWAGLGGDFARDVAYAQLIEDLYTRTMSGFVPNYVRLQAVPQAFHPRLRSHANERNEPSLARERKLLTPATHPRHPNNPFLQSSGQYSSGDRTQPPFFGFVAMQLFAQYGEAWLLEAIFDPLLSYLDFLWTYRRGAGLFAGSDGRVALFGWGSNNFTGADLHDAACTKAAAGYESGLDDSPMWDEAGWSPCEGGLGLMELYDAGLTGLFLAETEALLAIAAVIGRPDVVPVLQARFNATAAAMNAHLWNGTRGFYNNVAWDGTPSVHLSPTSYYPLMASPGSGAVPRERAAAMAVSLSSPLGMCLNTSAFGPAGPFSATTSRWVKLTGDAEDTATCASEACIAALVINQYPQTTVANLGALVLNASAAGADLVPLANWFSTARFDTALTNTTESPPFGDSSYVLQRLEGFCLPSAAHVAAFPGAPAPAPVTSWRKGNDTAACSSPDCEADMRARGYDPLGTLCWAFSAASVADYPCRFGAPSVSRDDPAFDKDTTGYYWRGRIWPATEGSLFWALLRWGDEDPGLGAARSALARQARALADFHWSAWGAVCENAHAVLGTCGEMQGQGRAGDDDPLLNWSGIGPYLSIWESRRTDGGKKL